MVKQAKENSDLDASNTPTDKENLSMADEKNVSGVSENPQDAISLLEADHAQVKQLFDSYKTVTRRADRARLVQEVCEALTIHAVLEEEIFYPACRELIDDDTLDEAQVEHDSAKMLINELLAGSPEDPFYDAKFEVLADQVRHHIQEEEGKSDSIFAKARSAGAELVVLGEKLKARKAELSEKAARKELHAKPLSFKSFANLTEEANMGSYQRGRDYDERGSSRYRDEQHGGHSRDEQGRFASDEDNGRGRGRDYERRERDDSDYRSSSSSHGRPYQDEEYSSRGQRMPERDEYGRFTSDRDSDYRSSSPSRGRSYQDEEYSSRNQRMPERDEYGRFMSDDDRRSQGYSRGRDYEDERRTSRGSGHGGWFGDHEGHSEAARKGWDERDGERRSYDEDTRGYSSQSGGRRYESRSRQDEGESRSRRDEGERRQSGHGGWFGDPEGHSQASRRGWQHRG